MTAFASIVLAALPGLGAKSGADGAVAPEGQGLGGAFEALMATLTAAAPAPSDARGATATSAAGPFGPGVGLMAVGTPDAASAVPGDDELVEVFAADRDGEAIETSEAAGLLTLAGMAPPAPTPAQTVAAPVAAPGGESQAVAASPPSTPAAPADSAAPAAPAAPVATEAPVSQPVGMAAPASSSDTRTSVPANPAHRQAEADAPVAAAPRVAAPTPPTSVAQASGDSGAAAAATAAAAPPPQAPEAPVQTVAATPSPVAAAPRTAGEAVVSLIGRVLDGARKPEAEAAVRDAVAAAAPDEVPVEAAIDTPVEVAVDAALSPEAPVPVEAAVVETPAAPVPASGRRAARADAVRAEATIPVLDAAAPDLKPTTRADARPAVDAAAPAPVARPELPPVAAALADAGPEIEPATLDAAPAAPTLQASAEVPVEAPQTRGSPETVARLAADIVRKLEGQTTRFDVQLDPLGLGKVDVSIEINADGRLSASLSFDSSQTAADLRGRAGELRQALEKAGFDLADGGLSFDMNNPGGSGGREAREPLSAWSSRAFQTAQSGLEQADALAARSTWSRTPSGGVDIRI